MAGRQNISHYRYQLIHHLFLCIQPGYAADHRSSGWSGCFHGVTKAETRSIIEPMELFEKYATIDRMFAELDADLNGAADKVTVTYDPAYGFPTEVTIDFVEEATDDELYLATSNFEELP